MNDHKSQQQLEPDFFDLKFEDHLDSRLLTSNGGGRSLKTKKGTALSNAHCKSS
jgi:hypothetical protein